MVAASLILAALLGAPFSPRSVVPVTSAAVTASVQPAAFNPSATARAHVAKITITPAIAGTATTVIENQTGAIVETLGTAVPVAAAAPIEYTWAGTGVADGAFKQAAIGSDGIVAKNPHDDRPDNQGRKDSQNRNEERLPYPAQRGRVHWRLLDQARWANTDAGRCSEASIF